MEKANVGQWQRSEIAIGCCSCGVPHPSHLQRHGNREARRRRQRAKWQHLRDERAASQIAVRSLSPFQGGNNPRILEATGKLQILQQV